MCNRNSRDPRHNIERKEVEMVESGGNSNEELAPVAEKGYLKPRVVGPLVFIVLTLCILSGVVVSILAIFTTL